MRVGDAKEAARQWVNEHAGGIEGFRGAFFHGSVNWLCEEDVLGPASDLDVMLVLAGPDLPAKPGKLVYHGALLEVSYIAQDRLKTAEQVLGDYHLAGSFRVPSVIADPTCVLTKLQEAVARDYARREWVCRRCEHARGNALAFLNGVREGEALHDQAMAWLFGNGVLTHILLVAGLRNPTVRKRYLVARELLTEYGMRDLYEELLESFGCAQWGKEQAESHLASVAEAFDTTKKLIKTPYQFAADLTDLARPVAIDGSRELIEQGYHREAVFWIAATYSRCQRVLAHDAPAEVRTQFDTGYRELLGDLGIANAADLKVRGEGARRLLPRIWEGAEAIMAANPAIE